MSPSENVNYENSQAASPVIVNSFNIKAWDSKDVKKYLLDLYEKYPNINIKSCAVTGYGEELIKNAFNIDYGVVETIAHYTAAKKIKLSFC